MNANQNHEISPAERLLTGLGAALLLSATLFFFGPAYLYFNNILELPFFFGEICYYFAGAAAAAFILLALLALPWRPVPHRKITALLFALGFLLWAQGHLLVWNYGLLDGREIEWGRYWLNGAADTVVWVAVLGLALVKTGFVYRLAGKAAYILVLVQAGGLLLTAYFAPAQPGWKSYIIDTETRFAYSGEKNVIILVLDSFQADVFQEIIDEDERFREMFEGFTFFRNALGGYPNTYPSIPLILTGNYYDNSVPIQNFIEKTFSFQSLPLFLKENGFRTEAYPLFQKTIYCKKHIFSNLRSRGFVLDGHDNMLGIYKITFFRHLPHFFKRYFHIRNITMESNQLGYNMEFMLALRKEAVVFTDDPVFKFYHLVGAHAPFTLNEKLEYEELETNRTGLVSQSKANLLIAGELISKLKELDIYEVSMIIVIGDHGRSSSNLGINIEQLSFSENEGEPELVSKDVIASAIPLILVKPFGTGETLQISDAPVTLADIPKTVLTALDLDGECPGFSMFEVAEEAQRQRRYYYYLWTPEFHKFEKDYLPLMQEYLVEGFSWFNSSWRPAYREYAAGSVIDCTPPPIPWGETLHFGREGGAAPYLGGGWSAPEEGFTWTSGEKASLILPLEETEADLIFTLTASPFLAAGQIERQPVVIWVNGEKVGEWVFSEKGERKVVIPNKLLEYPYTGITLELPGAASPAEMDTGEDTRVLALAVQEIRMTLLEKYRFGSPITFGREGNAGLYLAEGWSEPEKEHTWTDGSSAALTLPVAETEAALILTARFSPFLAPGAVERQRVNVLVNGRVAARWLIDREGAQEKKVIISASLQNGPNLEITFELPDATSPSSAGLSEDGRWLGLAVENILIAELPFYRWGTSIRFGYRGNAPRYQWEGWSVPEGEFTWSDGEEAVLLLSTTPAEKDLRLKAFLFAYFPEEALEQQRIEVQVNGRIAGRWVIGERTMQELELSIPREWVQDNLLELVFRFPDAVSPSALGTGADGRTLGAGFYTIVIEE